MLTARDILEAVRFPLKVYHGTVSTRLDSILHDGLTPQPDEMRRMWRKERVPDPLRETCVSLATNRSQAAFYASHTAQTVRMKGEDEAEGVVLQVTLTQADVERLRPDHDYISRHTRNGDEIGDWEASLDEFGQVAYEGVIPPERLRVVR